MNLVTMLFKPDLDVQQTYHHCQYAEVGLLNKGSCLAAALGVTNISSLSYEFGHTLLCWSCCLLCLWGGFVEHLSKTYAPQQSVTKIIHLAIVNLVTPKAAAKHELSLNKALCLYRSLGVSKFTNMRDMILVTLCCAT
jgi:hypothetical protein